MCVDDGHVSGEYDHRRFDAPYISCINSAVFADRQVVGTCCCVDANFSTNLVPEGSAATAILEMNAQKKQLLRHFLLRHCFRTPSVSPSSLVRCAHAPSATDLRIGGDSNLEPQRDTDSSVLDGSIRCFDFHSNVRAEHLEWPVGGRRGGGPIIS